VLQVVDVLSSGSVFGSWNAVLIRDTEPIIPVLPLLVVPTVKDLDLDGRDIREATGDEQRA